MELSFDPVISLLGIYPKNPENTNQKEYMHLYVHSSVIYNSQDLEIAQVPSIDEWNKKIWYIYTVEYCVAIRKKKFLP